MKNWGILIAAVAVIGFAALPALSDNNAAVVIKDFGCGMLDGDGGFVSATGSITVSNNGGVTTVVCKVKGVANGTGKAVQYDFDSTGLLCGTLGGPTDDWKETVSASGNATLVCRVKN